MECVLVERFTDSQTFYIIFDKSYTKHWSRFFINPKFQHVHLVRDSNGQALMINSFAHVMCIREYPCSIESFIEQEAAQKPTAILQLTVHYASHYKPAPIEILTCVSICKRLLGIRTRCITPKGLYHELIKAGATVLNPYCVT